MRSRSFASLALLTTLAAGCDADETEPVIGLGIISALSTHSSATAEAQYRRFSDPIPTCPADSRVEGCLFRDCTYAPEDLEPPQSAGTIAITGGLRDVTLTPEADGTYVPLSETEPLFEGGEVITFEIAGDGEIPSHRGALRAPELVTVTAPVLTEPLEIPRSENLSVSWSALESGYVAVSISVNREVEETGSRRVQAFSCEFPGWRGTGAIPSQLLTRLPAIEDPALATISVETRASRIDGTAAWEHWLSVIAHESAPITLL